MRNSFYLIISLFVFNSCAYHSGVITSSASLTNANFQVVELAIGKAQTTHVFGIGGLKSDAIVFEAKQDLLRKYPLKRGQVLANISVDFKRSFYLIVMFTEATITADIVDFSTPSKELEFDQIYYENLDLRDTSYANFNLGDSAYLIYDAKMKRAKIIGMSDDEFKVKYKVLGNVVTYSFPPKQILKMSSSTQNIELYGFDVSENVLATLPNGNEVEAVIFGINSYHAGVKYAFDYVGNFKWTLVPLNKLSKVKIEK
jgi:hypothetical protein